MYQQQLNRKLQIYLVQANLHLHTDTKVFEKCFAHSVHSVLSLEEVEVEAICMSEYVLIIINYYVCVCITNKTKNSNTACITIANINKFIYKNNTHAYYVLLLLLLSIYICVLFI